MPYIGNKPAQTTEPANDSITNIMVKSDAAIALSKLASDPTYDDDGVQNDIALLGFKVAANGSLSKYNLVDQTIDDFQDATGIDASASTNDERNASDYYIGSALSLIHISEPTRRS